MAKDLLFRTSISGFNKKDVTDYIEELNISCNNRSNELESEIKALKKELEAMPELLRAKEEYDKIKEENEILLKERNDLDEAMKEAMKANTVLVEEKEAELERITSENSEYKEKIKGLEDELTRCETEFQEASSSEIEKILEDAYTEAEKVIAKAQSLSKEIIEKAKEKAEKYEISAANAEETVKRSNDAVKDNLKKVKYLNKKKDELSDIFLSHKTKVDSFFSSISQSLNGD